MPEPFGTSFLLQQGSGVEYEVLRKCHYNVEIQGIDSRLACQDTVVPRYGLEQVEVYYYNDRVKVAKAPNPSEMTIDILDFVQPAVVAQLWTWFKQIYDPNTRNMGYASDYKRQGKILLFDPVGVKIRTWTVKGLWPMNAPVQTEAWSYEQAQDVVKVDMTFSCDSATLDDQSA